MESCFSHMASPVCKARVIKNVDFKTLYAALNKDVSITNKMQKLYFIVSHTYVTNVTKLQKMTNFIC